jgi:hypothetical protein
MSISLIAVTPLPSTRTSMSPRYSPLVTKLRAGPSRRIGSELLKLTTEPKRATRFPPAVVTVMPPPPRLAT